MAAHYFQGGTAHKCPVMCHPQTCVACFFPTVLFWSWNVLDSGALFATGELPLFHSEAAGPEELPHLDSS